jgi:uncharacterized protein (UPF0128 family)
MGDMKGSYMVLARRLEERDHLEDLGVDWRIILKLIFKNEKLNNLYSSPNIIRVIKSRRMRWAGHVARMGEGRGA